jgi:hypothetical protein
MSIGRKKQRRWIEPYGDLSLKFNCTCTKKQGWLAACGEAYNLAITQKAIKKRPKTLISITSKVL